MSVKSLQDIIIDKYIESYKAAPFMITNAVQRQICRNHVQKCNMLWKVELPKVINAIKQAQCSNPSSIEPDWYLIFGHLPHELVTTAKDFAEFMVK